MDDENIINMNDFIESLRSGTLNEDHMELAHAVKFSNDLSRLCHTYSGKLTPLAMLSFAMNMFVCAIDLKEKETLERKKENYKEVFNEILNNVLDKCFEHNIWEMLKDV